MKVFNISKVLGKGQQELAKNRMALGINYIKETAAPSPPSSTLSI
jgi:hypothetical protein